MKKKLMILISGYFLAGIIISCCNDVKYYDFRTVEIVSLDNDIELDDSLNFQIKPLDLNYLAKAVANLDFFQTAYAFDCDDGWGGMKYAITKLEIRSDSDFTEGYLANSLLNDLVTVNAWISPNSFEHIELKDFDLKKVIWTDMYLAQTPTIDKSHKLTVIIYKSNGDIITAESEEISWNKENVFKLQLCGFL